MKIKRKILTLLLVVSVVQLPVLALDNDESIKRSWVEESTINQTVDVNVNVDESNIIREADNKMLGLQWEAIDESVVLQPGKITFNPKYGAFADTLLDIPLMRMGGVSIEMLDMSKNIGPMSNRAQSFNIDTGDAGSIATNFGVLEWVKAGLMINPDAEFIPCLSMSHAKPEDNAKIAQYLLHTQEESQWGQLRASNGVTEPVNVLAFELGNEVDLPHKTDERFDRDVLERYKTAVRNNIDAIKAVCPNARFMLCGNTSPPNDPTNTMWTNWNRELLQEFGNEIQFISFHQYYSGYELAYTEHYRNAIRNTLYEVMGEDTDIKIVLTEHAKWYADEHGSDMVSLEAALATAQFLNRMYLRPEIYGATYHGYSGQDNMWSAFKLIDNEYYTMGTFQMYDMYNKAIGDRVVSAEMESDTDYTNLSSVNNMLTVLAMPKGEHELNLILCNRIQDTEFNINFDFLNDYTLTEESIFTAPNTESYVGSEKTKDVFRTTVNEKNEQNFTKYTMPAKSVVTLKLTTKSSLPQIGATGGADDSTEAVYTGDSGFSDVDYSYARNEINILKDAGIVSGTEEGKFSPDKLLTRAEFAQMLKNTLQGDTAFTYSEVFSDVRSNDWFYDGVMYSFGEGLIKGKGNKLFDPNDGLTIEELATIATRVFKLSDTNSEAINIDGYLSNLKYQNEISDWAREPIAYGIKSGFLNRLYENGELHVRDYATREQATLILYRIYKRGV